MFATISVVHVSLWLCVSTFYAIYTGNIVDTLDYFGSVTSYDNNNNNNNNI